MISKGSQGRSTQWPTIFIICLCWISRVPYASTEGSAFCYDSEDPSCPPPGSWGGSCNDGSQQQSPIQLPGSYSPSLTPRGIDLQLKRYRGNSFQMINNGHTVAVQFPKDSSTGTAPIALGRKVGGEYTEYRLDSAHFHWGRNDTVGSEHCLKNRCFSMELHLVHYRSDFDSVKSAIKSSDPNTLAVIGIMFEVSEKAGAGNKYLAPIVQNLNQVVDASHSGDWTDVNTPLDFTQFLSTLSTESNHFTYKGSLTTPDCTEKVNWYVFDKPIAISHSDVEGFRNINDARGEPLIENRRPLQSRNNRNVYYAAVRKT